MITFALTKKKRTVLLYRRFSEIRRDFSILMTFHIRLYGRSLAEGHAVTVA